MNTRGGRTGNLSGLRIVGTARRSRAALLRGTALQAVALTVLALPALPGVARAQPAPNARPTGGTVVGGQATITRSASTTTITQTTPSAGIAWQGFDVGSNQTVDFVQPGSRAVAINKVVSPDPSQIAGRIEANGQVVIVNQSGVVFSKGAQVDTAGLVVSAAGITDQNLRAGRLVFDQAPRPNAAVVNAGTISVRQAGLAALVAPHVANAGVIRARMGRVVLAGATAHTVDLYGDGLLAVDVTGAVATTPTGPDGKPAEALVTNTGVIAAEGGTVLLTARAVDGLVSDLVQARGRIAAAGGTVVVDGIGGSVRVDGTIDVAAPAARGTGGAVEVNATAGVTLGDAARVVASGAAGGGTVAIGTNLARARGGAATRTAQTTAIAAGARVSADATGRGQGGRVVVLSSAQTTMAGTITARGGAASGDGGFVEVSGKAGDSLTGTVDTGAVHGHAGSILLDPGTLTISDAQPTLDPGAVQITLATGSTLVPTGTLGGDNWISPATINAKLTGAVTLQAATGLTVASPLTTAATITGLELDAGGDVNINAPVNVMGGITLRSGVAALATPAAAGNIKLDASVAGTSLTLDAHGGTITQAPGFTLAASGGNAALAAGSAINLQGIVSASGTLSLTTSTSAVQAGAPAQLIASTLSVSAGSSVQLDGPNAITKVAGITANNGAAIFRNGTSFEIAGDVKATGGGVTLRTDTGFILQDAGHTIGATGGNVSVQANGTLFLNGIVQAATGGSITLTSTTGSVIEAVGGVISGDSLAIQAATGIALPGANTAVVLAGVTSTNGDIVLRNATSQEVKQGITASGGNVTLTTDAGFILQDATTTIAAPLGSIKAQAGSNLTLHGTVVANAADGIVTAIAGGGSITQDGSLSAFGLTGSASASATFTGTEHIAQLGAFAAHGALTVADADQLTVTGAVQAGGGAVAAGAVSNAIQLSAPTLSFATGASLYANTETQAAAGTLTVHPGFIGLETDQLAPSLFPVPVATPGGVVAIAPLSASTIALGGLSSAGTLGIGGPFFPITIDTVAGAPGPAVAGTQTLLIGSLDGVTPRASSIVLAGPVTFTGAHTLGLFSSGAIAANGNTITTAALIGAAKGGDLTLDGAQAIGALGVTGTIATGGTIVSAGVASSGVAASGNLALTSAAGFAIDAPVSAGSNGTLTLVAQTGSIAETAAGTISAGTLTGSAPGSVSLASAGNQIATLGSFASGGSFTLTDGHALIVSGAVNAGSVGPVPTSGSIAITDAGAMTVLGSLSARGTSAAATGITLKTTNGGDLNQGDTTHASTIFTDGAVAITAAGTLTQAAGSSAQANDTIMLTALAAPATPGITLRQGGTVIGITGATLTSAAIDQTGEVESFGTVAITAQGAAPGTTNWVRQSGTIVAGAVSIGSDPTALRPGDTEVLGAITAPLAIAPGTIAVSGDYVYLGTQLTSLGGMTLSAAHDIFEHSRDGTQTGAISAATLTGSAGGDGMLGSAELTGANAIGTLAAFAATRDFVLNNATGLQVTGAVSAGTASVATTADGRAYAGTGVSAGHGALADETAAQATIVGAGTLAIALTNTGALTVSSTGSLAAGHAPDDAGPYAGGHIVLTAPALDIEGVIAAHAGSAFLAATGTTAPDAGDQAQVRATAAAITVGGTVVADPLYGQIAAGQVTAVGSIGASGTYSVTPGLITLQADAFAIGGRVSAPDGLVALATLSHGTFAVGGPTIAAGDLARVTTTGGGIPAPDAPAGIQTLVLGSLDGVTANDAAISFSGAAAPGVTTLALLAQTGVTEDPTGSVRVPTLTGAVGAGGLLLPNVANAIGQLGVRATTTDGALTVTSAAGAPTNIAATGDVAVGSGNPLNVIALGNGRATVQAGAPVEQPGISLAQLALLPSTSAGSVSLQSGGAITIEGDIVARSTSAGGITLAASDITQGVSASPTLATDGNITLIGSGAVRLQSGADRAGGNIAAGGTTLTQANLVAAFGTVTLGAPTVTQSVTQSGLATGAAVVVNASTLIQSGTMVAANMLILAAATIEQTGTLAAPVQTIGVDPHVAVGDVELLGTIAGGGAFAPSGAAGAWPGVGGTLTLAPHLVGGLVQGDAIFLGTTLDVDTLTLIARHDIIEHARADAATIGAITASTLSGSAGFAAADPAGATTGNATLDAGGPILGARRNLIGTLAGFAATGTFALNDAGALDVTGPVSGTAIAINVAAGTTAKPLAADLTLAADIGASGSLKLQASGAITQTGGALMAGTLTAEAGYLPDTEPGGPAPGARPGASGPRAVSPGASITLPDANAIGTLAGITAAQDITLTDPPNAGVLTIAGNVFAGTARNGAVRLTLTSGDLSVVAGGTIQSGFVSANTTGDVAIAAGNVSVASGGAIGAHGGTLAISAAGAITLAGALGGDAAVPGDAAASVLLSATGAITEPTTPGAAITAALLSGSAGGAADFAGGGTVSANRIGTLGSFTSGGGFTLRDGQALTVAGPVTDGAAMQPGGITLVADGGDLTLAGPVTALASGRVLIESSGNVIETTGNISAGTLAGEAGFLPDTDGGASPGTAPAAAITPTAVAQLTGGNAIGTLAAFAAARDFTLLAAADAPTLAIGGAVFAGLAAPATLTIGVPGALTVANGGTLATGQPGGVVALTAGGAIVEAPDGHIITGTLTGRAASASLTGGNAFATLGGFTTQGGFTLTDASALTVAAPLTDGGALPGRISLTAPALTLDADVSALGAGGAVSLFSGAGITQTGARLVAATLTGSAVGPVLLTSRNTVGAVAGFTVSGNGASVSEFALRDDADLTLSGTLSATAIIVQDPGHALTLDSGLMLATGQTPVQAGSIVQRPLFAADGAPAPTQTALDWPQTNPAHPTGGAFLQADSVQQNGSGIVRAVQGAGDTTLGIDVSGAHAGRVTLNDLQAPKTRLFLELGAGSVTGPLSIEALYVSYTGLGGSAQLTGTVGGQGGVGAASVSFIEPSRSRSYRLNACPIGSVNCILLSPISIPVINPVNELQGGTYRPSVDDSDLVLPNIGEEDY